MKIVPWIIVIFMIYVVYYFISRSEKRITALEKRLNQAESNYDELKKQIETNRMLIQENSPKEPEAEENAYED
ncbi:hypothetical protein OFO01_06055 [Campylobacter sp. JMF_01 NE2]|uniref:hypothetical protein n=1 Tax=unclassified Campylobacter TaxID=2593542 RepID=UPI001B5A52B4|nr:MULTISPECIES: hypothetical protein [unclassified Campylobacter]MBP3223892.1 hypothetical protein [Campylobacter sp.]MDA3046140.1 hypothetical protein [Campylobacter sp. VBCF_06 NA8]MDA3048144.1 hypothetical protein [Campylobacter sp. JMF_08 NE1]MDA3053016.1 hypothetical protein [Campylobacter sp. JMF_03 NE3]MDA3067347.1 hypothetical protein [Campylobacter sp. JMF_01 NE2]